ncbi:MAG: hypothetical protein CL840_21780 [Crocinitomicaceae bacterium]|nr:hypothetical protein [Crocinitomicaceae bacterium]|tara:strand:+ start:15604 stop:15939 length:336 start_codon:yes stop_codon:yes gene_type:complete
MRKPIEIIENQKTKVVLESNIEVEAILSIGLVEGGDFSLKIEFKNLQINLFKQLINLSKLPREIQISSPVFEKEKLAITHIVITDFVAKSDSSIFWNCLSDDPNFNLSIES